MTERLVCPKCGNESGDDWSQCEGVCPMSMSPHYAPALAPDTPAPQPEERTYAPGYTLTELERLANLPSGSFFLGHTVNDLIAHVRDLQAALRAASQPRDREEDGEIEGRLRIRSGMERTYPEDDRIFYRKAADIITSLQAEVAGAQSALHHHHKRATDQIFGLNEQVIALQAEVARLAVDRDDYQAAANGLSADVTAFGQKLEDADATIARLAEGEKNAIERAAKELEGLAGTVVTEALQTCLRQAARFVRATGAAA